jgi:hypothetical protein
MAMSAYLQSGLLGRDCTVARSDPMFLKEQKMEPELLVHMSQRKAEVVEVVEVQLGLAR